jgi:uridine phosphorylase
VISEVYGFAVGATTVEELVYHGIDNISGIGYVGAFDGAPMGQSIIAKDVLSDLPLATHYGVDAYETAYPTSGIYQLLKTILTNNQSNWGEYQVWNSNSLYRESPVLVQQVKEANCEVVNMDTLSIYAVGSWCKRESNPDLEYIYVGTVTDSANNNSEDNWESDLIEAVQRETKHPHDDLVKFMVEEVLSLLS